MYVIFYNIATSKIIGFREDMSSPAWTLEEIAATFNRDNNITDGSVGHAAITKPSYSEFNTGMYLYNSSTKTISENPSYVAPTPPVFEPTPTV
jgi:hypothetical protein